MEAFVRSIIKKKTDFEVCNVTDKLHPNSIQTRFSPRDREYRNARILAGSVDNNKNLKFYLWFDTDMQTEQQKTQIKTWLNKKQNKDEFVGYAECPFSSEIKQNYQKFISKSVPSSNTVHILVTHYYTRDAFNQIVYTFADALQKFVSAGKIGAKSLAGVLKWLFEKAAALIKNPRVQKFFKKIGDALVASSEVLINNVTQIIRIVQDFVKEASQSAWSIHSKADIIKKLAKPVAKALFTAAPIFFQIIAAWIKVFTKTEFDPEKTKEAGEKVAKLSLNAIDEGERMLEQIKKNRDAKLKELGWHEILVRYHFVQPKSEYASLKWINDEPELVPKLEGGKKVFYSPEKQIYIYVERDGKIHSKQEFDNILGSKWAQIAEHVTKEGKKIIIEKATKKLTEGWTQLLCKLENGDETKCYKNEKTGEITEKPPSFDMGEAEKKTELPEGWVEYEVDDNGHKVLAYHNTETGETSWDPPSGFKVEMWSEDTNLPNWKKAHRKEGGATETYYWNTETGETSWDLPQ